MKIIFCGAPEFAVPTLLTLIHAGYPPALTVTQPDRPRGRGQKPSFTSVKEAALSHGLPVCQPEKFNTDEMRSLFSEIEPDLAVVVAYSAKIGQKMLEIPKHGWLNLHPSLLPKYRGAAPLQWAIAKGETESGITAFFLNEAWDAGAICLQKPLPIPPEENYADLAPLYSIEGAGLILDAVIAIEKGHAPRIPQDDSLATFAPLIRPEDGCLDWQWPAREIHNRVRAFTPKPGCFVSWNGKRAALLKTALETSEAAGEHLPGEVAQATKQGLLVQTGEGLLRILEIKPENRAAMSGADFINGAHVREGMRFESI